MGIQSGEVIAINLTDDDSTTTYAVTVRIKPNNQVAKAYPLNANIKRVPIIGESVLIIPAEMADGASTKTTSRLYYIDIISIQQNIHHNALPTVAGVPVTTNDDDYESTSAGNPNSEGAGSDIALPENNTGFVERGDVGSLQPFLGDLLIEGRFGHSLRFGYSPDGADTTKEPSWSSSTPEGPITILSNGRTSAGSYNKFIIEDVDADLSSIWLTSSQKVKLSTSNNIPSATDNQSDFKEPSIILNSDRVILNSKSDYIILSGAKSVVIATPAWAMDMDTMFTLLEGLTQQVADLTAGTATFATGVGPTGPATNVADVKKLLSDLQNMAGGSKSNPPAAIAAAAGASGGASGGSGGGSGGSSGGSSGSGPVDQNNVPQANRLREVIRTTGNKEKGIELSNGGDITPETADLGIAVVLKIKELMPSLTLNFTGGNDKYHQVLSYTSRHKLGRGLDFVISPASRKNIAQVETILTGFMIGDDPNFRFINEYATPSKAASGSHFHMSWGSGTEAARTLRRARRKAKRNKITAYKISDAQNPAGNSGGTV